MIPIKKGIESTGQPAVSIESGDSSIPRKPILLEGGPAPEPITVTALTVTENGTHDAGENAAYNPVIVNVPSQMASEYLESEWDLLHCNSSVGFYNSVKNVYLTGGFRGFENGYLTNNNDYVNLAYSNYGDVKRFVVEMGAFDRTLEPSQQYFGLFSLVSEEQTCVLYYDNDNDRWLISESPIDVYISGSELPKYALENATVEIIYGAKYIDGTLYRGKKVNNVISEEYSQHITMYIHAQNNQEYVIDYNKDTTAHSLSEMFTARIGTTGSVWTGALFKNAKIYKVLNCYNRYYESEVQ